MSDDFSGMLRQYFEKGVLGGGKFYLITFHCYGVAVEVDRKVPGLEISILCAERRAPLDRAKARQELT